MAHRYVAIDDVAALWSHVTVALDPPAQVEFGGPEALSRRQVVAAFESAAGRPLKVRHVPRAAMSIGRRALARIKPARASGIGLALFYDTHQGTWEDTPLREAGIVPRPAGALITHIVGSTEMRSGGR